VSHQNLLSEAAEQSLLDGFRPVAKEIMLNEIRNVRKNRHGHHFSDNIRTFALAVFLLQSSCTKLFENSFLFAKCKQSQRL